MAHPCPGSYPRRRSLTASAAAEIRGAGKEPRESLNHAAQSLLRVPFGRLDGHDVARAEKYLAIAAKWQNEQGATLAERLLERLYNEQSRGRNRDVVINAAMYNLCLDAWGKSGARGDEVVRHAEALVARMEERFWRDRDGTAANRWARPDSQTYNRLLHAYSQCEDDSAEKVERVLEKMTALADDAAASRRPEDREHEARIRPDAVTYTSAMNYHASRRNENRAAKRAEDLLLRMSDPSLRGGRGGPAPCRPTTAAFNVVLKAWGNSGGGMAGARRAEDVLRSMARLHAEGGHENARPDAASFATVLGAYGRVATGDADEAVKRVLALLDELEGTYLPRSDEGINACYNAAANAIVKAAAKDAVEKVEELRRRMKNMDAVPDGRMMTSVIEAYAIQGSEESLRHGKELLLKTLDEQPQLLGQDAVVPFNILLKATLRGDSKDSIEKGEELMVLMDEIGGHARPDSQSYRMMLGALSRSSDIKSEQKAVEYLRKMLTSYGSGYEKAQPDSFVFNCVIGMLARSEQGEWADNTIHRTLSAMQNQQKRNSWVSPDTITYNMVIGKLARRGTPQNAKKAMKLLERMERDSPSNEAIAPDIITYSAVLRLQARVDPRRAAHVAASYLDRAAARGEGLQADRQGVREMLLALSRSRDPAHARAARRGWEWAEKSEGARDVLDADLCNLVPIAYSKTGDAHATMEALLFLLERINRYHGGESTVIFPTRVGFSVVLGLLGKANRIDDALGLLDVMKALSEKGVPDVNADDGCYNSILLHLARSRAEDAAAQALRVVRYMQKNSEEISTASLNSAINACASTLPTATAVAKSDAVKIAFQFLNLGKQSNTCDAVTFGLMIRTCIKLTHDKDMRCKLVEVSHYFVSSQGISCTCLAPHTGIVVAFVADTYHNHTVTAMPASI